MVAIRPVVALLSLTVAASLLTACRGGSGSAPDKAGGSTGPVVLRLGSTDFADQSESPAIRYFADQVAKVSNGQLRIRIVYDAGGDRTAAGEENVIRKVESGKLDLGWIAARAWDEVGVKSFTALQAPFLITSYSLLGRVTSSPLATRMLDGLSARNDVGLALVPMELRHPSGGLKHRLVAVRDFRGARIRDIPSRVGDDLLRALGARPVHVSNAAISGVLAHRRIDGSEVALETAGFGSVVTANVTFFAKAMTLFAGQKAFDALAADQRAWLKTAAGRMLPYILAKPPWRGAFARYCRNGGRVVRASRDDLTGLERASRPVSAALERDRKSTRLNSSH